MHAHTELIVQQQTSLPQTVVIIYYACVQVSMALAQALTGLTL